MINLKLLESNYENFVSKLRGKNINEDVLKSLLDTFNELKKQRQILEDLQAVQNSKVRSLAR